MYLIQYEFVEVGHVSLAGNGSVIIIAEMLLQSRLVVRNPQYTVQVVGQNLNARTEHFTPNHSELLFSS